MQQALQLHQQGQLEQAAQRYQAVLAAQPNHFDALHFLGLLRSQQGRHAEAADHISAALALNPTVAPAWSNLAIVLRELGRFEQALAACNKALANNPNYAEAHSNRGNALKDLGRLDEAVACYDKALALKPSLADALNNRGNALADLGRPQDALQNYDKALKLRPNYAEARFNRGNVLRDLGRLDEALASYDKAVGFKPAYPEALNNRGNALLELGRHEAALASFDRALALKPDYAEALYGRGNVLAAMKQGLDALASYDQALGLRPSYMEALNNRGVLLLDLNRPEDALTSFEAALAIKPDYAEALCNRGSALVDLRRHEEAVSSSERALALEPDYPEALINRGNALFEQRFHEAALASYEAALAARPDFGEAHNNRGNVLFEIKRFDEALASYRRAVELQPGNFTAVVRSMMVEDQICSWVGHGAGQGGGLGERQQRIASCQVPDFDGPTLPFLWMCDDPAVHAATADAHVRNKAPAMGPPLWQRRGDRDQIRLGYLSADFNQHPVAYLVAELIELHDRSRFEVYGFSAGADDGSAICQRLQTAFDVRSDVGAMSDAALARHIAAAGIDIVVELGGLTKASRMFALARRPAPVQVTYLGYAASTRAPFIDYTIVDPFLVPPAETRHFTEKLAYLPDCFQCNDRKREIAATTPSRAACGLPADGIVFCCFNNTYKINPAIFDIWMRLLTAVPGAVLWLTGDNSWAQANLRREAQARGVDPTRIVFAARVAANADHLARQRLADLFLDTLPYNAHTTASDALWVGLPVVTCPGTSMAARVAGSLLHAIGLPEMVTSSLADYEALALRLATNPAELQQLRAKLECNRSTHPLFDTDRFRRNIEAAYTDMWSIHRNGDAPRSFNLPA